MSFFSWALPGAQGPKFINLERSRRNRLLWARKRGVKSAVFEQADKRLQAAVGALSDQIQKINMRLVLGGANTRRVSFRLASGSVPRIYRSLDARAMALDNRPPLDIAVTCRLTCDRRARGTSIVDQPDEPMTRVVVRHPLNYTARHAFTIDLADLRAIGVASLICGVSQLDPASDENFATVLRTLTFVMEGKLHVINAFDSPRR